MAIVPHQSGDLLYLIDESIETPHAFTSRLGGVSQGIYASLNLGVNRGDDPAAVSENYDRITSIFGIRKEDLVFTRQVHGDTVRLVGAEDRQGDIFAPTPHEADGLVTAARDLPLMVFTADCIPILLWDQRTGAVGAVHAGWRSTVLDIVGKAVSRLVADCGSHPQDIRAAIGPGIGRCCFETGPEVSEAAMALLGYEAEACVIECGHGKRMVDLKEVNRRLLLRAGLFSDRISVSDICTMCNRETFWSHRATAGHRGSQAALILCSPNLGGGNTK
ncbi:MAG: peptidoglycan editing factor PgeF [Oscillospiraceae bacterium]|nr:peptidoglycan editing factor PgeF [Oscillospiraceae bacterium]